jgi:hypothetical protein
MRRNQRSGGARLQHAMQFVCEVDAIFRSEVLNEVRAVNLVDAIVLPWPRLSQVRHNVNTIERSNVNRDKVRRTLSSSGAKVKLQYWFLFCHVRSKETPRL